MIYGKESVVLQKNRFIIPSFITKLFNKDEDLFIITIGMNAGTKRTISIYPLKNWEKLMDKLLTGNDYDIFIGEALMDSAMGTQVLEGPGRLRISKNLLERAGLKDKDRVWVAGKKDYISVYKDDGENAFDFDDKKFDEIVSSQSLRL